MNENNFYEKIIIGAGLYGLYSAWFCGLKGQKILVIEKEKEAFTRATYVNQARVHMGYHYPRSFSTAIKSANYFDRFVKEYPESIYNEFEQIYATSKLFSWTNSDQFQKFCNDADIVCNRIDENIYFKKNMCDGAFETKEYTYDAMILRTLLLDRIKTINNVEIIYDCDISQINRVDSEYVINTNKGKFSTGFLLNCTYASTNQILKMAGFDTFKIKYELCEIILCKVSEQLKNVGITVMDGPFFSIMPFGKTGYHSLTSVTFTPHIVSYDETPKFRCQNGIESYCNEHKLGNCNFCENKPNSSWVYMSNLAKKYLNEEYSFEYVKSLYSMKPILKASEIDDSRPTVIKQFYEKPYFYSVLSGKINTIYDLEEIL